MSDIIIIFWSTGSTNFAYSEPWIEVAMTSVEVSVGVSVSGCVVRECSPSNYRLAGIIH